MGKSKRKYRKKNKRTRKKRGGDPLTDITKNPDVEDQNCIHHLDPDNELYNKGPTWIKYLEAANKGNSVTSKEKLAERKKWCGLKKHGNDRTKKGYCHSNSGTAEVKISNMTNDRCLPKTKQGKTCRIRLRPEDVYHCTRTCGRPNDDDKDELKKIKKGENKLNCNDAGVHIGNRVYSLVDSLEAMEKYDEEVKKRKEKEKKEKAKKAKALAKAEAAAKKAREEAARLKEIQDAEAKKARETALAKEKKRVEDAKMKCVEDMKTNLEKKFSEIEKAILTHNGKKYNTITDLFDKNHEELFTHDGIKLVEEKLRMLNGLNHEVSEALDDCFDEISDSQDFGQEADDKFEAAFEKYKGEIDKMYVDIVNVKMDLFNEEEALYGQYTPTNLKNGTPFAQIDSHGSPTYMVPSKCREKKVCDDKRKAKIKEKKNLSKTPEFCIGSVVRGGIYPKSSFDYTGVVIGNAIEKGVPPVYLNVSVMRGMSNYPGPLYPVVYHSPYYNNGSWPFYGLMYGVHRPKKSETEEFKTWYYKMIKRHGDTTLGKYPEKTLQAMIKGIITQKGKKNLGKNPQLIPIPFIDYLPCKQTKAAETAYNKSKAGLNCTGALACKNPKYQRSKGLCDANTSCKWIGKKGGRRKRKRTRRKKKKKRRCTKKKR